MIAEKQISEHLSKTRCYKCGFNLGRAKITPITEIPVALIAHAVCPNCSAESIITINLSGTDAVSAVSDLKNSEVGKFINLEPTSYDELLRLHKKLQKKPIWKLLQQSGKRLEKNQKVLEKTDRSQP